ncbi:DNA-binding protein [Peziza echinospora]|nr:DNA-binding protein [Peziza echinospora]
MPPDAPPDGAHGDAHEQAAPPSPAAAPVPKPERPVASTLAGIVASFADFLTVAVHTVLYERGVYSPDLFLSTRIYNHHVRQARHPRLCRWIQDAVEACTEQIAEGTVSKVCIVILGPVDHAVLERYVFDVSSFPTVPPAEHHTPFQAPGNPAAVASTTAADMEEQLRATLGKLSMLSAKLKKLPDECTFTISMELKEEAPAPVGHATPWVASETRPVSLGSKKGPESNAKVTTTPVRTIEAGAMFFEVWIEKKNEVNPPVI